MVSFASTSHSLFARFFAGFLVDAVAGFLVDAVAACIGLRRTTLASIWMKVFSTPMHKTIVVFLGKVHHHENVSISAHFIERRTIPFQPGKCLLANATVDALQPATQLLDMTCAKTLVSLKDGNALIQKNKKIK